MKNKDRYKICEGCISASVPVKILPENREKFQRGCMIGEPVISETVQCPCITCLIKGICIHACEAFNNFVDLVVNSYD